MKSALKILSALTVLLLVATLFFWLQRDSSHYCRRASVRLAKGDFGGALADCNKAIELNPDFAEAYIGRGDVKYKQGDPDKALADYDQAAKLKPGLNPAPDLAQMPEAIVTNEIGRQALALLETNDYVRLERLAATFRSSKERYADGVWKLACVYDGLVPENRASDETWESRLSAIKSWAVARPESITARVAWANILVAYGWRARGAGETYTVSKEGWRLFGQRLMDAAKILKEARPLKEHCPLYWRVLMRAALGLQIDQGRFDAVFDEATRLEPECESYYLRRTIYFLPQWYGSDGQWQSDLARSADKIGGEKGDMLYAQVIWNLHPVYFGNPFQKENVSWSRVDRGFEVIEKCFPDSLAAKIERAQLAVLARDTRAAVSYNNGNAKQDKGDFAGAIKGYDQAVQVKSNYARAYGNRGNAKRAKGDLDGALADYTKAIEIQADYGLAFYNRATAKRIKGDLSGAMADFNKVIQLQPDFAAGYAGRAGLKQANGDYDGAMVDFTKAIDLKPDFVQELYTARGNIRQYKGDRAGAAADFNLAAKYQKAGR